MQKLSGRRSIDIGWKGWEVTEMAKWVIEVMRIGGDGTWGHEDMGIGGDEAGGREVTDVSGGA